MHEGHQKSQWQLHTSVECAGNIGIDVASLLKGGVDQTICTASPQSVRRAEERPSGELYSRADKGT